MAYSVTPLSGINLYSTVNTNPNSEGTPIPTIGPLGLQAWGNDGKRYVLAKAAAAITAGTTVCSVNPTTFAATATGGTYASPAVALATNDIAWFATASV
jgi:hypothetical protein